MELLSASSSFLFIFPLAFFVSHMQQSDALVQAVRDHGMTQGLNPPDTINWVLVAQHVPGKGNKQCRMHWSRHHQVDNVKADWTPEEDEELKDVRKAYPTCSQTCTVFIYGCWLK